jgi:sugar phosphate isomerase/epimerase
VAPVQPLKRYAVCQSVLRSGDLATDIGWAGAAGATGIGLDASAVLATGIDAVVDLLAQNGLAVSSLQPALDPILTSTTQREVAANVEAMVTLCTDLGASGIMLTTGPRGDRSIAAADRACAAWLSDMAPIAADAGVSLLLEPVHPLLRDVSYVHSLRHAVELTAGQAGTALVADTGHLWWDRRVNEDLTELASAIGSVQIDDIDGDALVEMSYRRTQLGDGVIPLAEIIEALETSGYRGFYENEVIARIPRGDRTAFVRLGGERLAALLHAVIAVTEPCERTL